MCHQGAKDVKRSDDLATVVDPTGESFTSPGHVDGGKRVNRIRERRLSAAENDHCEYCQLYHPRALHGLHSLPENNIDVRAIADALGVTTIREGSVRRSGNRIRVTAQLNAAVDGTHLWSQRYDREMKDVFAVQDAVAPEIAGMLQIKLTAPERRLTLMRPRFRRTRHISRHASTNGSSRRRAWRPPNDIMNRPSNSTRNSRSRTRAAQIASSYKCR